MLDKWLERIKGLRKWTVMMVIIIVGIIFRVTSLITGLEFVGLIKGVAVAFMASNAVEHVKGIVDNKKEDMKDD